MKQEKQGALTKEEIVEQAPVLHERICGYMKELKVVEPLANKDEMTNKLAKDITGLLRKLSKVDTALNKIIMGETFDRNAAIKLVASIDELGTQYCTCREWAIKFNLLTSKRGSQAGKGRKRKAIAAA